MTTHRRLLYRSLAESKRLFPLEKKKKERRCLGEILLTQNLKKELKSTPSGNPLRLFQRNNAKNETSLKITLHLFGFQHRRARAERRRISPEWQPVA